MGSSRLPGKVLAEVGGRPALALQLERLRRGGHPVVVATSTAAGDDPVASLSEDLAVPAVRGPEDDVLGRFRLVLDAFPDADPVVRLTADCPLTDPKLVDVALAVALRTGADHTSNVLARTFPDGFDVEVVRRAALLEADARATRADEREHVTPFIVRRPGRFPLASFCSGMNAGLIRLTLDLADDLAALRNAVARVGEPVTAPWNAFFDPPGPLPGLSVWPVCAEGPLPDRRFVVRRDGEQIGSALVTVDAGTGRLVLDVPSDAHDESRLWVTHWLGMDAQVVTLT